MLATFDIGTMMSQANQIKDIPVDMLKSYHNHKFSLYTGERLEDMVESVKRNGVLIPIIVQPIDNGESYEILSGHNRTNAARLAGLSKVPAVIKEGLTEEEAEIYVVATNLAQRGFSDLKISEQAAVLSMRHSKLFSEEKQQAIADELAVLEGKAVSKLEKTGEEYGLKKDTVARLLRVDKLLEGFKPWVDSKELSIRAAVKLSYISPEGQEQLYNAVEQNGCMSVKIDMKKASALYVAYANKKATDNSDVLDEDELLELLLGDEDAKEKKSAKVPKLSQAEIYAMCDSGAMNGIIEGYCRVLLSELGIENRLNAGVLARLFKVTAEQAANRSK